MILVFKLLFQHYLKYCIKNTAIIYLFLLFEHFSILFFILKSFLSIFQIDSNNNFVAAYEKILRISPLEIPNKLKTCSIYSSIEICTNDISTLIYILIISLVILKGFILYIVEDNYITKKSSDNTAEKMVVNKVDYKSKIIDRLSFIFVNLLDGILHIFSIGIFFLLVNEIFAFFNTLYISKMISAQVSNSNNATLNSIVSLETYIKLLISIGLLVFYLYIYVLFILNINLIIQYNKELSTHYDNLFSIKYDFVLLILKLLASISEALSLNKIMSETTIKFVNVLALLIYLGFNLYILVCAIILKKIIFLMNGKFNSFRIFLLSFSCMVMLCFMIFYKIIYENVIYSLLSIIISFIIAIFLVYYIDRKNCIAVYSTDNYIFQMIYILNIKYNSSVKELYSEIGNLIFYHKNYCLYHSSCKICKIDDFSIDVFLRIFYERIREIIKNKNNISNLVVFDKNDKSVFNIIKLLMIENLEKNKIIKLIYKTRRIIEKYEMARIFDNKYFNLIIYNNHMRRLITKNQILKFKIIQCYEDTSIYINETLKIIENLVLSLANGDKYIFQKSATLYELKNKILKNVQFLSFYQNYFVDTYLIIIYRFIFKNLFNCDINDFVTIYNFEEIKELVNYMYSFEKLIQIKLNFNTNSMKLIRLGKDLIIYQNKCIEELIPMEFRDTCIKSLLREIKSSDNEENKTFEFVIIDEDKNLKSIKINFTILASFKLDEVMLIGKYEIIDKDLILLKKLDSNYSNNLTKNSMEIVNFSQNLNEIFFLKSNWLDRIKLKFNINLTDVFEEYQENNGSLNEGVVLDVTLSKSNDILDKKAKSRIDENKKLINKEKDSKAYTSGMDSFEKASLSSEQNNEWKNVLALKLNYSRYSALYQRVLLYIEEEMSFEELKYYSKLFRKNLKNNNKKKASQDLEYFSFIPNYNIQKDSKIYILYTIQKKIAKNLNANDISNNTTNNSIMNNEKKINATECMEQELEKINVLIKETDSVTSSSKSIGSKTDAIMAADSSRKIITNNDEKMNKFTVFSLIFCIFLVIYCVFFLIMGIANNNNIRKLYQIRNKYNDFRYFFYHTAINFFFNIAIFDKKDNYSNFKFLGSNSNLTQDKENTSNSFFSKFQHDKNINFDIPQYVNSELSLKINMLRDIYLDLQNEIYSSHYKEKLDLIFNNKTDFLQLSTVSGQLSISKKQFYFFETINIFYNHGKVIVQNIEATKFIYLYIISAKDNAFNFSNIQSNNLSEIQIKMYEILLNYVTYYLNFIRTGDLINSFFSESLSSVFNMTYLLSFLLMGIHLFLFFGGVFIIKFLYRIVKQNEKLLKGIKDPKNLQFLNEKIKNIKVLNDLFTENPKLIINKLNKNRTEFFKLYVDSEKRKKIEDEKKDLIIKDKSYLLDINFIVLPFIKILLLLFFFYYIYSFIFYIVFKNSYEDFILTSDFSNQNIELDNKMMNNVNLLSSLMLLNKTESDLSYEYNGKRYKLMMDLLTNILKIRIEISKYRKKSDQFKILDDMERNLMNCTYIYYELNDEIFSSISKMSSFPEVFSSLKYICQSYKFMNTYKLDSIFDEISFNGLNLYNQYHNSDYSYEQIKQIYEDFLFYDTFLIFIFIFRPIRKFSNNYIYNNIIMISSTNYLIFTIAYLILNIIVDLTIFYIINRLIVKKISDINKHFNNLISCLTYKFSENMKNK